MRTYSLGGIFALVPTPFSTDGEIAWEHFVKNITRFGKTSLNGIVVLGTNGEAVALREIEKINLLLWPESTFLLKKSYSWCGL